MGLDVKFNTALHRNNSEVVYTGRWLVGASGTVTKVGNSGVGLTLTRTAVGLYTLAMEGAPVTVVHIDPVRVGSGGVSIIMPLTLTTTGGTFRTSTLVAPGTPADPAAAEVLTFRVSSLRGSVR